jgi:hypothetical protein
MHGFGSLNQSLPYYQYHVPKQTRPFSPHSDYVAPQVFGGTIIMPRYLLTM